MKTLGERIRFIRGEETQADFADRVGIAKGSIGGYENDKNSPSADAILKICLANDISCEWLLKGLGPMRLEGNEKPAPSPETSVSIIPQQSASIEKILVSAEEERRELATENRRLYREKEELLREIGELREKVARLEERKNRLPGVGCVPSESSSGVA